MLYIVFAVFLGGLAGFFVVTVAPYAAGSGIPEVELNIIRNIWMINGFLL